MSNSLQELDNQFMNASFLQAAYTPDVSRMTSSPSDNVLITANNDYHQHTDLLAQMNESWNASRYIAQRASNEKKRLEKLDALSRREVYMLRQRELYAVYVADRSHAVVGILIATVAAVLLALMSAALWRAGRLGATPAVWLAVGVGLLYAVALFILLSRFTRRRRDVWDKPRWELSPQLAAEMKQRLPASPCST